MSLRCGARPRLPAVLAAALLLLGAAGQVAAQPTVPPLPAPPAGVVPAAGAAPTPCWLPGLAHAARCGTLRRALDPAQPQGPQITLHYALLPALARRKAEDAVFFFAGGPGQSAIDLAGPLAARFARLGQRRDLVFIDQRGTGRSAPLKCADDEPRTALRPLADSADGPQRLQRLRACRQALQALPHGDLRHYATHLAAADTDAVRQALSLVRFNAIGFSYGTRLVLDYQRQFPQALRRAVLDGVVPPDMRLPQAAARDNQAALDAWLDACVGEPACTRRHPALRAQWQALLQALPQQVSLPHPVSGQWQTLRLDREHLLAMVRAPLYAPMLAAALPAAVAEASAGRWAPLAALAGALGGGAAGGLASGQHFSVVCTEDLGPDAPVPPADEGPAAAAPGAGFGSSLADLYQQVCADWPRGRVPAAFYRVLPARAPVWLLSGGLDPVTPPRHGQRLAHALGPQARHIVVPNAGHGVLALGCLRDAVQRFISTDDDEAALASEADCAATVPRPPLYAPPGVTAPDGPAEPAR